MAWASIHIRLKGGPKDPPVMVTEDVSSRLLYGTVEPASNGFEENNMENT